ncbi:hypothetical protein BV22DRAFT_1043641 [Leucogyrophana mollusca]|uniref:Uncharacterized protein n=1 Tax=Leucogyrophana mollusca TaxID=85980 RepID=A0ACB8BVD7_9AGAM|nr:hypothetical protein BV22DRAFT_1043641 [Leucogyrophana mollusca]
MFFPLMRNAECLVPTQACLIAEGCFSAGHEGVKDARDFSVEVHRRPRYIVPPPRATAWIVASRVTASMWTMTSNTPAATNFRRQLEAQATPRSDTMAPRHNTPTLTSGKAPSTATAAMFKAEPDSGASGSSLVITQVKAEAPMVVNQPKPFQIHNEQNRDKRSPPWRDDSDQYPRVTQCRASSSPPHEGDSVCELGGHLRIRLTLAPNLNTGPRHAQIKSDAPALLRRTRHDPRNQAASQTRSGVYTNAVVPNDRCDGVIPPRPSGCDIVTRVAQLHFPVWAGAVAGALVPRRGRRDSGVQVTSQTQSGVRERGRRTSAATPVTTVTSARNFTSPCASGQSHHEGALGPGRQELRARVWYDCKLAIHVWACWALNAGGGTCSDN